MPAVTDQMGRIINVPERPQRIISLVPSQTELLYDLGLEDEVVGITKFCVHPEAWFRSKTRIGGTKTAHIDKIKALKPDFIIANKEENVKEQIEALESIAPVWVSDIHTLQDAQDMIAALSRICCREMQGADLLNRIGNGFESLKKETERSVAYCIWRNPWMWAGADTFINDMLLRLGWKNVLDGTGRYPALDLEAIARLKPGIVLLSSEPYPFKEKHIAEMNAVLPDAKVLLADGEMFSWYGSRLLKAPQYFQRLMQSL